MTRMPNKGKKHAVYIDNLFISSKLLSTLRDYGIEAAGTVRTSKTKREENEEKREENEEKREENEEKREKQKLKSYELSQNLDSLQDLDLPQNEYLQLAFDLIQEIKEDLDQNLISQIKSQNRTTKAKKLEKEKNFEMNEKLIELKTKWSNYIA
jgi:protein involved in polysaccharide export with SLBB domain